ncbi:MAG: 2-aminoethylphosphonate--pyruvate transaminase [Oceanospirillaceae bacterium]|nr:2-aminoethylphosphonate--pyruvate transaminase [Oceanospirillaceae bacterium]
MNDLKNSNEFPNNPYLLLTPGPLSTTNSVKSVMLKDWCTWDNDYNSIVQKIRAQVVGLATKMAGYTSVLMQGSGTASVESVIGSVVPVGGKLAVLTNGVYGKRILEIAKYLQIPTVEIFSDERVAASAAQLEKVLAQDTTITHVAVVHCETTTGMLNPLQEIAIIVKKHGKVLIVDAMSSFGGIEMDIGELQIDYLISSSNKCIQGVPGFGLVIAKTANMQAIEGISRSLSLDLYAQWKCMEDHQGKWRFTSPTHVVRAFDQALEELQLEGGISARAARYRENQRLLVEGMRRLGFQTLLTDVDQSPIITSFYSPDSSAYSFEKFYYALKQRGFVIYPGKVSSADCFRIGNIGDVHPQDIERLISAVEKSMQW